MAGGIPSINFSRLEMNFNENVMSELNYWKNYMYEEEDKMYDYFQTGEDPDFDFYYEVKHFKVNTFLKAWSYVKELGKENIQLIVDAGYFRNLGYTCNWMLMSRKFDMKDELFMKHFKHLIDMDFAKKYNSTYVADGGDSGDGCDSGDKEKRD
jgi:hypothetical protein